jgi:nitrogen fixation NifU-like protein
VIAISSIVTESIKDTRIDRALRRSSQALSEALHGMPSEKMLYSVMVEQALERAIHDYRQRDPVN